MTDLPGLHGTACVSLLSDHDRLLWQQHVGFHHDLVVSIFDGGIPRYEVWPANVLDLASSVLTVCFYYKLSIF